MYIVYTYYILKVLSQHEKEPYIYQQHESSIGAYDLPIT